MGKKESWSFLKIVLKSWILHVFIILFVSFIVGFELAKVFTFSQETLLWLTSTIVQAYGAMIAIIIAVGLHQKTGVKEVRQNLDKLIGNITDIKAKKALMESRKKIEEKRTIISKLNDPIQAVVVLIFVSIFVIVFINKEIAINPALNSILGWIFIFLLIHSLYCLQLIVNKICNYFMLDD